jgi:hypothetical protein
MANDEHVALLKNGVEVWNKWRHENLNVRPDLRGAGLIRADLRGANLNRADLIDANLREANLNRAELGGAILKGANLKGANLIEANLIEANLIEANLYGARLWMAKLSKAKLLKAVLARADLEDTKLGGADLRGAKLQGATLVRTDLTGADLTGCRIYGVSAWELKLETTKQQNLVITSENEPEITVDNIEVAQFIYLMLNNQKVRDVIDTITSKAVLILGRFTDERKAVLDALREELRKRDYLPILFDFDKPRSRDTDERSHCSLAWRDSSLPIFLMQKPCCRSCEQLYRTFPRCPCNQLSSRYRRSRVCSTFIGTGRRF